jgi:dienelactone hydrolase
MSTSAEWSIRTLLNPVITRLLIYGVNPIDLEEVLVELDELVIINGKSLEKKWAALWDAKAAQYLSRARQAEAKGQRISAGAMYQFAAQCHFAVFLINSSQIEDTRANSRQFAARYRSSVSFLDSVVEKVEVPLGGGPGLAAYLHLPRGGASAKGAVVFFAGLGSCKEEMNTLARAIVDRGVAVLVPDMPGNGESLFEQGLTCNRALVRQSFTAVLDYLALRPETRGAKVGSAGLCMGGGYAYKAAWLEPRFAFCATLFPLYIADVPAERTPAWMKSGDWYQFQTGGAPVEDFLRQMAREPGEAVHCPFLLVHGSHDNWMSLDKAMELYEAADHPVKEKLIIEGDPVFSRQEKFLHTMPVGEQLHWVRHVFADWIAERVDE